MSHRETHPTGFKIEPISCYSSAILSQSACVLIYSVICLVYLPLTPGFSFQDHGRDCGDPQRHLCIHAPPPVNVACSHIGTSFLSPGRRGHKPVQYGPTPHSLESWPPCLGTSLCPKRVRGPGCGEPYYQRAPQPCSKRPSLLVLDGPCISHHYRRTHTAMHGHTAGLHAPGCLVPYDYHG